MKYASAISLAMAPVAMAKAVHNAYPVRRDPSKDISKAIDKRNLGGAGLNELLLASGLSLGTRQEVIVIWVNQGGGVPTQTLNAAQTVTTTVTVAGGAGQVGVGGQQVGAAPTLAPAGGQAPPAGVSQLPPAQGVGAAPSGVGSAPGALFTHEVTVGGPTGLSFKPQEIKANVGDMVVFTFLSQNHTLTQSAFATPCEPLAGGMDSGYQANANNTVNPPPRLAMQVMVAEPLWFYCKQNGHCGKGMAFSINATPAKTHAMFQAMAIAQNGTGGGSAITGNGGAAPAGGNAPPAGSQLPPAGQAPTGTLAQLPGQSVGAVPAAGTGVATGTGVLGADGSCVCSVECGSGSFPAVQAQGAGNFGGMAGALPQNMAAVR